MDSVKISEATLRVAQTECSMLVARYCHLADGRDFEAFVELFAPDGEWIRPNMHMVGREKILEFMRSLPLAATRHVMGSVFIDVLSGTNARGRSYCQLYRETSAKQDSGLVSTQLVTLVNYDDHFKRYKGKWLFAQRKTTIGFANA